MHVGPGPTRGRIGRPRMDQLEVSAKRPLPTHLAALIEPVGPHTVRPATERSRRRAGGEVARARVSTAPASLSTPRHGSSLWASRAFRARSVALPRRRYNNGRPSRCGLRSMGSPAAAQVRPASNTEYCTVVDSRRACPVLRNAVLRASADRRVRCELQERDPCRPSKVKRGAEGAIPSPMSNHWPPVASLWNERPAVTSSSRAHRRGHGFGHVSHHLALPARRLHAAAFRFL